MSGSWPKIELEPMRQSVVSQGRMDAQRSRVLFVPSQIDLVWLEEADIVLSNVNMQAPRPGVVMITFRPHAKWRIPQEIQARWDDRKQRRAIAAELARPMGIDRETRL